MAMFGGWRLTRAGVLFFVGVIVLAGLVTGGIFLVKNHSEAVRREEAIKIAEKNLEEQSKPDTIAVDTEAIAPADDVETVTAATTATAAEALPATGIDDLAGIGRILIVAVIAFAATSYISSRRAVQRL